MAKGKARKEQTQKLLATVVMGMNLVNTVAPMAAVVQAGQQPQLPRTAASEAQPLDYAVLPQALDYLDRAVFATAEAKNYSGNETVPSMGYGDYQNITSGQSGTATTVSGGFQSISNGGSGTVITMYEGGQQIYSGGNGTITTMSGGRQDITDSGNGTVSALNGGTQVIEEGGTSLNTVLNSGGTVYQNSGGIISSITYSGGMQIIDNITVGYDGMTLGDGGTNVTMGVTNGA